MEVNDWFDRMANTVTYVQISGHNFDPQRFDARFHSLLGGSVGVSKKIVDGELIFESNKWNSEKLPVGCEEEIIPLIAKITEALRKIDENVDVRVVVYRRYDEKTHPRGLFLSTELIAALAKMGACLDYDLNGCYPRWEMPKRKKRFVDFR